jgi:hypothetical protein
MSLPAYFDKIMMGRAMPGIFMSLQRLDEALRIIEVRPTPTEQAALLSELDDRFVRYGRMNDWLAQPKSSSSGASVVVDFIINDLLGVQGDSVKDSTIGYLSDELKKVIQEALNDRGKKTFKLLELLTGLAECKTPDDAVRVLSGSGLGMFGTWLAKEETRKALIRAIGKRVGLNAKARNKIIRLVAAHLTWFEIAVSRLAWVMPVLAAIDVFLTPESTADDATMKRLTFLTVYGRMQATRQSQFGKLVSSCTPDSDWVFRSPLQPALREAILRMR